MSTRFATTGPEGPQLGADDAANLRTQFNALRADLTKTLSGDYLVTAPTLSVGSTATAVASTAFTFAVNGVQEQKAAVTTGTAPGNDVIPQAKYGAVALDIAAGGTVTVVEAAANATGYATAALALAGLAAVAADKVRMGTVVVTKSDGAFTFGTTDLDAANVTAAFASGSTMAAAMTSSDLTG